MFSKMSERNQAERTRGDIWMKKVLIFLKKILDNDARAMGLLFGILAFVVTVSGLASSPRLGTVDSGKYENVMAKAGLVYTPGDQAEESTLTYTRVIENYGYGHFSYAKLLAPSGCGSLIYPVALIRLVTEPFGLDFSTIYLYMIYAAAAAYSVYALVRGTAYLAGRAAWLPGALLLLLLSDRNLTVFFNSLYSTGTMIIGFLLASSMLLRALTYRKGRGGYALFPLAGALVFLINASPVMVVFIPFAIAAAAGVFVCEQKNFSRKVICGVILAGILVTGISSGVRQYQSDPDMNSETSAYHAAFQGFLEASADPAGDLKDFGLDEDYISDIGNSYYQDADTYVHNPRDEEEAEMLFSKLNQKTIFTWYLNHPGRILKTLICQEEPFNSFETEWVLGVGQFSSQQDKETKSWSLADTLLKMLFPENCAMLLILFLLLAAGAALIFIKGIRNKKRGAWVLPAVILTWALGAASSLPLYIMAEGRASMVFMRVFAVFVIALQAAGVLTCLYIGAVKASGWFRRIYSEPPEQDNGLLISGEITGDENENVFLYSWIAGKAGNLYKLVMKAAGNRKYVMTAVSAAAVCMTAVILLADPRAGCVNNGDFGRMMEQTGLIWTGDIFYDTNAQLGNRVIEEYAYRSAFDFRTLTLIKPTYSLIYPVAIVRGICYILKQPFSTYYVSIVMSIILLLCILSIVRDMFPYLKKYTLLFGIGMCVVFLCESYLVWFNSLFGEGCIFLGVFMVAACCVHLAVMPQGKGVLHVFLLLLACRFLLCAKAQMLVALPVLGILLIVFALYHRPLKLKKLIPYTILFMILFAGMTYEGIRIYQDNGNISERQTVWQSVFYGALMVSDDPAGDMEELGIDPRMAADIGKDAYQPDADYVISPNSPEADEAFYDHVNTFTMVKYYLKRPLQLLKMLDYSAAESRELYNGFRAYKGQNYGGEHDPVDRLGLWLYWRPFFSFGSFWEYAAVYGVLLWYCISCIRKRDNPVQKKLLCVVYMGIMLIGCLQYPLSVIGNGFADNQKQMFGFMVCHDLLTVITVVQLISWLRRGKKDEKSSSSIRDTAGSN